MDTSLLVALFGILVAAVMRTLLPYVQKVRDTVEKKETPLIWDMRYLWTCQNRLCLNFYQRFTISGSISFFVILNNATEHFVKKGGTGLVALPGLISSIPFLYFKLGR